MKPEADYGSLVQEFRRIHAGHDRAVVRRTAVLAMGASVLRVYRVGTKADIRKVLDSFPCKELRGVRTQAEFRRFYVRQLNRVVRAVRIKNTNNERLGKGLEWGHCTKVLSLFMRDIVLETRLYTDTEIKRIAPMLCVPFDSIVLAHLRRKCGITSAPKRLKDIIDSRQFWWLQELLQAAATKAGTQAIHFDDVWTEGRK